MAVFFVPMSAGYAATWQICRLHVQIQAIREQPTPMLKARVLQVNAGPAVTECPAVGQVIDFIPESADYQSTLPRNRWPKPGQQVRMRYQYLDGTCKNDGDPKACRIRHYPVE
ncbi:hypothetical protein SAMN05428989_0127 [Pseudoxanthomonas sp. GM95]|nr:hypothetical protein SAMN05428989_0127 [Pseudoxanthomonas sp. GM95]